MSWIAVAVGGATLIGGVIAGSDQEDAQDAQAQNNKDTAALTTQRDVWLAQQQEKWNREDAATQRSQKQADIGVFQKYQADPSNYTPSQNMFQQSADSTQAPTWDPTQLGTMGQFLNPGDANGSATPVPTAGGVTGPSRGSNIIWQT